MDQAIADKLYEIRHKHLTSLTEADKDFLRARKFYLGKRDQAKYKDIIGSKSAPAPKLTRKQTRLAKEEAARLAHPAAI